VFFLQFYLLQNRSFGWFFFLVVLSSLVSVLELFLVVGRLYFKPWVGFVMLFFCSGFVLYLFLQHVYTVVCV
jgi:hypothetical protein